MVAVRSDVSKLADTDTFLGVVAKELGRINVAFANAGIAKFAPAIDISEALYDETFGINTKGVFFTMQKAIAHLNDGASVILNTSIADEASLPATTVYAASKAAVRSLARTFAVELAPRGIRVNAVTPARSPGYTGSWACLRRRWTPSPPTLFPKYR